MRDMIAETTRMTIPSQMRNCAASTKTPKTSRTRPTTISVNHIILLPFRTARAVEL